MPVPRTWIEPWTKNNIIWFGFHAWGVGTSLASYIFLLQLYLSADQSKAMMMVLVFVTATVAVIQKYEFLILT